MRSTIGKVSAVMILLALLIGSILVLNIARAQNSTDNSVNVPEIIEINDFTGNENYNAVIENETDNVFSVESLLNIILEETVGIVSNINENVEDDETSDETSPLFVVNLGSGRITRGEIGILNANVLNTGSLANNVYFDWVLPEGFELVSGDLRELCGNLETNASCYAEIGVIVDPSIEIGLNEVKIVVHYEE